MPQLTIPGFSGDFEDLFADMHARSRVEGMRRRQCNDPQGSGITVDGKSPTCDDKLALRDPDFGFYEADDLACGFVQGFGAGLGPCVRGMPIIDYVVWFLSSASDWLPRRIHAYLLDGLKDWAVWSNWCDADNDNLGYCVDYHHSLLRALGTASGVRAFKLVGSTETDLRDRIALSAQLQKLPEDPSTLVDRFLKEKFIERWFATKTPRRVRSRRAVNSQRKREHNPVPQRH
jgi:hypothetical protein